MVVVSMKSGLVGRNNEPGLYVFCFHDFSVSMKSGLVGRNNLFGVAATV